MALSKRTLTEFREWLVGWTLRTISDLFEAHGFREQYVPPERLPGGQRRSLVECYYAGIDLKNRDHVRRLLTVFEDVLFETPDSLGEGKRKLIRLLERDGLEYKDGKIIDPGTKTDLDLASIPTGLDTSHLSIYLDRINNSIENDPELAVGSAKELVEATLKSILRGSGIPFEESKDDVPALLKKVQKHLDLAPDDVDGAKKGADTIRRVLSNLGAVAIGVAELRNLYGTGHGRSRKRAVDTRLARLVVGSGGTLCRFLLETYEARKQTRPINGADSAEPQTPASSSRRT
jgi:hypothetical protein